MILSQAPLPDWATAAHKIGDTSRIRTYVDSSPDLQSGAFDQLSHRAIIKKIGTAGGIRTLNYLILSQVPLPDWATAAHKKAPKDNLQGLKEKFFIN